MSERDDDGVFDDDDDIDEKKSDVRDEEDERDIENQDGDAEDQDAEERDGEERNDESEDRGPEDGELSPIESMREMIEYIARALATNPDAVSVTEEDGGDRIYLHLSVDDQDKGKVIGRDGRVAQSMRSLLRVAAVKADTRVSLEID